MQTTVEEIEVKLYARDKEVKELQTRQIETRKEITAVEQRCFAQERQLNQQVEGLSACDKRIAEVNANMCSKQLHGLLYKEVEKLKTTDQVALVTRAMKPSLDRIVIEQSAFRTQIAQMNEVINHFDQTLSLKANKCGLQLLEQTIQETFVEKKDWSHVQTKFDALQDRLQSCLASFQASFDSMERKALQAANQKCETTIEARLTKYDAIVSEFGGIISGGKLRDILDSKVNHAELR